MLLGSEHRGLLEQSADALAADLGCGMKPAKESHPAEPLGQDMLKKAADELGGRQRDGFGLAGLGIAIRPEDLARRQGL